MAARAFRLEDLFTQNPSTPGPGDDPLAPGGGGGGELPPLLPEEPVPESPIPGGGVNDPLPPIDQDPFAPPPIDDPGVPGPQVPGGGVNDPMPTPENAPIPPASPTSATAPGSFANPGSAAARPLQPFNYRSLFDSRNANQGSYVPGARVPTTPANIAPSAGVLGGQSESAITRGLRRIRG